MSFVDVKNMEPTTFEDRYYDEYEYYNLTDRYCGGSSRKGRSHKNCATQRDETRSEGRVRSMYRTAYNGNEPYPPEQVKETWKDGPTTGPTSKGMKTGFVE
ncbi:hypothetical protein AGOR_G00229610 [Albula goreensis]|uniref:Uncharacterized protein n=1 Tax=Albula goreensis TaxID=1534307 RepID=A0A8T3CI50_9TELE|nr:hypothetical protein AGOR_G00229610 [Albula goreensis]